MQSSTDHRPSRNPRDALARQRGRRSRRVRWGYLAVGLLAIALVASAIYRTAVPRAAAAEVKIGAPAPDFPFTASNGTARRLAEFHGQPVLLWLLATWCPSCQAGTTAVADRLPELAQAGLQIVQLRLYQNLGYPGPSMADFVRAFAGAAGASPHWVWGDASETGSYTYDPRGYPDLYFLIDKGGIIRAIDSAPNVTMDQILLFARHAR